VVRTLRSHINILIMLDIHSSINLVETSVNAPDAGFTGSGPVFPMTFQPARL
jgi:hypothetical protein